MWFQDAMNWLDTFFNKPLPIVGVSLIAILSFAWFIFSKTSFGKKSLKKATDLAKGCVALTEETKKIVEDKVDEYKDECNKKVAAIEEYYETMLAQKQAKEDKIEELLVFVCDNVHNAKITEKVNEYKKSMDSHITIMTQKINEVKADYDERLRALEEKINEKVEEISK